ncbi:MAG: tryptophan--tRNA ligase [Candidatus Pacebacteria bacterium]|nr:tryptophan--tRNA ligase [Candidatus Paceibacterota bacterium]
MTKEIVLSGIRATARLHFGNFLGAVRNFVDFQSQGYQGLYFIADLHTLTTLKDPEELRRNLIEITKDYLAAGLDPNKSIIYAQSSVPEISELSLLLSMLQPMNELEGIATLKDLVRNSKEKVNLGMLTYPVLMAADILGPQATLVPVGEDQEPNVELARELARRFNNRFGQTFVVPEMMKDMVMVPGLDGRKMSKSDSDNTIDINYTRDEISKRYHARGVTDTQRLRVSDPGDPYNRCRSVYPVHEIVTPFEREKRTIANLCLGGNIGCRTCKGILVDSIAAVLEPFQAARADLASKDAMVREILHEGGIRARAIIRPTLEAVQDKMGVVVY